MAESCDLQRRIAEWVFSSLTQTMFLSDLSPIPFLWSSSDWILESKYELELSQASNLRSIELQ